MSMQNGKTAKRPAELSLTGSSKTSLLTRKKLWRIGLDLSQRIHKGTGLQPAAFAALLPMPVEHHRLRCMPPTGIANPVA